MDANAPTQAKPQGPQGASPPQPGGGMELFKHGAKPGAGLPPKVTNDINEILRRLRILEERYSNIRKKTQLTEQNMLEDTKRLSEDIKILSSNIKELKKEIAEVNSKMKILAEEMASTAQKKDLDVISKYIDFWEPMGFLKKDEAERIIEDILNEIKSGRRKI